MLGGSSIVANLTNDINFKAWQTYTGVRVAATSSKVVPSNLLFSSFFNINAFSHK